MKKMKTVRILVPMLLLFVLLSTASVVLATDRLTFRYAVTGHIDNMDTGVGASMSLILKGTLTLRTPDYDSSGWSDWSDGDRGWNNYDGGYDWWFSWNDPNIPNDMGFSPEEGKQYRAHIDWDTHEHWMEHSRWWSYRWYAPRGSWSGRLIAMWDGGTSPETFSVSLSVLKVEKILTEGNMYMGGDSWRHEHWDIYWVNTEDGEQHVGGYDRNLPVGGGFDFYNEGLQISFSGKFSTKTKRLKGTLFLKEDRFWMGTLPPSSPSGIGVSGNGEFGPYSLNFP